MPIPEQEECPAEATYRESAPIVPVFLWLLSGYRDTIAKHERTRHAGEKVGVTQVDAINWRVMTKFIEGLRQPMQRIHLVSVCRRRDFDTTLDNGRRVCLPEVDNRTVGALSDGKIPKDQALMMHTDIKVDCHETPMLQPGARGDAPKGN